jgi:hypothetical protein
MYNDKHFTIWNRNILLLGDLMKFQFIPKYIKYYVPHSYASCTKYFHWLNITVKRYVYLHENNFTIDKINRYILFTFKYYKIAIHY